MKNNKNIVKSWLSQDDVKNVLEKYNISREFFERHFAYKILSNIQNSYSNNNSNEISLLYILSLLFKSKDIKYSDLKKIYLALENVFSHYYDGENLEKFSLNIKNEIAILYNDMEDELFVLDAALVDDENRLRDIRFTSRHDLTSDDLVDLLEDKFYDIRELFQNELEDLIGLINSTNVNNLEEVVELISEVVLKYSLLQEKISSAAFFPVISNSFENLINFLSSIDSEVLQKDDIRELLLLMLNGLNQDVLSWIETVFIKKEADDVYYFDASFANNCLEIELQCGKNREKIDKTCDIDELMVGEDDLMFFEP